MATDALVKHDLIEKQKANSFKIGYGLGRKFYDKHYDFPIEINANQFDNLYSVSARD